MTPRTLPNLRAILPASRRSGTASTSKRQSACSTVICGFAAIVLSFAAMAAAMESVKPEWRDPEYGHRLKQLQSLHAAHPNRPLVVAVGSSRTQMGFSPAAMSIPDTPNSPLVYNFAQSGAGPLHSLLTVLRLLDDGIKPDFLLVELFPATLVHDGPAERQFARIVPRLTLADLQRLEPYTENPTSFTKQWAGERVNSWYSHRLSLMSHWQQNWLPMNSRVAFQWQQMDAFGFTPYPHEEMPPGEREQLLRSARKSYAASLSKFAVGATTERVLRDLIARCRSEGISLAFYLMPESPAFLSWYTLAYRADFAVFCQNLGVPVFNAATGFVEDEFADGHHLLRHGAARFSRRLYVESVEPWVRNGKQ